MVEREAENMLVVWEEEMEEVVKKVIVIIVTIVIVVVISFIEKFVFFAKFVQSRLDL